MGVLDCVSRLALLLLRADGQVGGGQVVQAGQHLGHDAALHLALGCLALGRNRVHLVCSGSFTSLQLACAMRGDVCCRLT